MWPQSVWFYSTSVWCEIHAGYRFQPFLVWNKVWFVQAGQQLGIIFRKNYFCIVINCSWGCDLNLDYSASQHVLHKPLDSVSVLLFRMPHRKWDQIQRSYSLPWMWIQDHVQEKNKEKYPFTNRPILHLYFCWKCAYPLKTLGWYKLYTVEP